MHAYTPANNIFDDLITNLLSILCILIEIFSPAHAKGGWGGGGLNDFIFGTSIVRFPSEGADRMAVKELMHMALPTEKVQAKLQALVFDTLQRLS